MANLSWKTNIGLLPVEGGKVMPVSIDLTSASSVTLDLIKEEFLGQLSFVQGMYIDNSLNTSALNITCEITNLTETVPAGWQGWIAIAAPDKARFIFASSGAVKIPVGLANFPVSQSMWPAQGISAYPSNQTPVMASSGNLAAAAGAATLPAVAGKTNYLAGASLMAGGATAGGIISPTITGLKGGTMTFTLAIPAGVTLAAAPILLSFYPPLPASAPNVAIVANLPSAGAGNTNASVSAWGFVQ